MVNREEKGFVSEYGHWPVASIPTDVEDFFWELVKKHPDNFEMIQVGRGYHNQGWRYIEIECRGKSYSAANEILNEIYEAVMWRWQE